MQNEWSTRPTVPAASPAASGPPTVADVVGAVPDGADGGREAATGDDPSGEEDLHRSAVDAVDGLLDEVEQALARLDDGTYGRCEVCGATIDDERLAELPIVRTCGRCDGPDAVGVSGGNAVIVAPGPIGD